MTLKRIIKLFIHPRFNKLKYLLINRSSNTKQKIPALGAPKVYRYSITRNEEMHYACSVLMKYVHKFSTSQISHGRIMGNCDIAKSLMISSQANEQIVMKIPCQK